jgi:molybdopterin converting factor small subunit
MDIEVRLFAALQQDRFRRKTLEVPEESTPADVCRKLAIGPKEVAMLLVNGLEADRNEPLQPGDAVSLFPAIGGG